MGAIVNDWKHQQPSIKYNTLHGAPRNAFSPSPSVTVIDCGYTEGGHTLAIRRLVRSVAGAVAAISRGCQLSIADQGGRIVNIVHLFGAILTIQLLD